MKSNTIIEKLNKYEFHDMVIESISFNHDTEIQLIITALPFNDNTNEYEKLKLIFSKIRELKTDEIILDKDSELELYSFDYKYNEFFKCKMLFLLGFGKPSLKIELKCDIIDVVE